MVGNSSSTSSSSTVPAPIALGIVYKTSVVAATLFKAPHDPCPGSTFSVHPPLSFHFGPFTLTLLSIFVSLSLLSRPFSLVCSFSFSLSVSLSLSLCPLHRFCRSSFYGNSMPDNKGDCMYYLACLSHACPYRFPIYFRISPRATRPDASSSSLAQCNTIKSNPRPRVTGSRFGYERAHDPVRGERPARPYHVDASPILESLAHNPRSLTQFHWNEQPPKQVRSLSLCVRRSLR